MATSAEIAKEIGLTSRAIEKQIRKFKDNGVIHRIGNDKSGRWEIEEESH